MSTAIKLGDALERYLKHGAKRGLTPGSLASYRRNISRFIEFLESKDVKVASALRQKHVDSYEKSLVKAGSANSTIAGILLTISKWTKYLVEQKWLDGSTFGGKLG